MINRDKRVTPQSERIYPYKMVGSASVRCRSCGQRGLTSQRFVGKSRAIDKCADCRRRDGELK